MVSLEVANINQALHQSNSNCPDGKRPIIVKYYCRISQLATAPVTPSTELQWLLRALHALLPRLCSLKTDSARFGTALCGPDRNCSTCSSNREGYKPPDFPRCKLIPRYPGPLGELRTQVQPAKSKGPASMLRIDHNSMSRQQRQARSTKRAEGAGGS